jgi:alkyl hydroperoxide reductase subunit F
MLDLELKEQVKNIFAVLDADYILSATAPDGHESKTELSELLEDMASTSDKITFKLNAGNQLMISILKNGNDTGIRFRGIPNGHEFSSLILAILNSDCKGKNIPDEAVLKRVKSLKTPISLKTYVSLTCTNCPDVVQALNIMAIVNPGINHEMVDGAMYQEEAESLKINAVPSVYANGSLIHVGKAYFGELLDKLEKQYGIVNNLETTPAPVKKYDVIVIGGGPAGSSAAIYSARKGLNVAIIAEQIGGQVRETVGIENLISVPKTTGEGLAFALKTHINNYPVDILENRKVEKIEVDGNEHIINVSGGERYTAPAIIIATGAKWRRLNVPGETEHIGRGVAFCPHCDGPFYKDKRVAVIGGGNSGIEAAIDLAGTCSKVTVFEFLDELRADKVLQDKVKSLQNVEIFLSSQTTEVIGDSGKVSGIRVKDRKTNNERIVELDGIFVQIGLEANSAIVKDIVNTNPRGEIEIDAHCRTNIKGIYAAGDVTNTPYKQIIISMGEGAKAALSAFEDRMRG